MNDYCEDCGTKLACAIRSNCHEELYIVSYQSEFITESLSDEFMNKAVKQEKGIVIKK